MYTNTLKLSYTAVVWLHAYWALYILGHNWSMVQWQLYPECNCHNTITIVYIRGRQWSILYKGGAFDVSASHSTIMYIIFMNNAGPNTNSLATTWGNCGSQNFAGSLRNYFNFTVNFMWSLCSMNKVNIINIMIMNPKICITVIVLHYHCKYLIILPLLYCIINITTLYTVS